MVSSLVTTIYPVNPIYIDISLQPEQDFEFLEFFAGRANLTYAMRKSRRKSGRFDILYNSRFHKGGKVRRPGCDHNTNYMDLCTPAGFALPVRLVPVSFRGALLVDKYTI